MATLQLPNGETLQVPDDATQDQVQGFFQQATRQSQGQQAYSALTAQQQPTPWDYVKTVGKMALQLPEMVRNVGQQTASQMLQPNYTFVPTFQGGQPGNFRAQVVGQTPSDVASAIGIPAAIGGLAEAVPSFSRAGQSFEQVMNATRNVPIDTTEVGNIALKAKDLASSGGSMPKVLSDFLRRTTDPKLPDITYSEARDFYSNATRLSADEFNRLTPVMKRQVALFTQALNKALQGAAESKGLGPIYTGAMNEYSNASRMARTGETLKDFGLRKALPAAGLGVAGGLGYLLSRAFTNR